MIEKFDLLQSEIEKLEQNNPDQILVIGIVSIGLAFLAEKDEGYKYKGYKDEEIPESSKKDYSVFLP